MPPALAVGQWFLQRGLPSQPGHPFRISPTGILLHSLPLFPILTRIRDLTEPVLSGQQPGEFTMIPPAQERG